MSRLPWEQTWVFPDGRRMSWREMVNLANRSGSSAPRPSQSRSRSSTRRVRPEELSDSLGQVLTLYADDVTARINAVGEATMKELVRETRRTAPKKSGDYRKAITYTRVRGLAGDRFVWYARGKAGRLTHLLVHGHDVVRNGRVVGRVKGSPFLERALSRLIPDYLRRVEGVLGGDE